MNDPTSLAIKSVQDFQVNLGVAVEVVMVKVIKTMDTDNSQESHFSALYVSSYHECLCWEIKLWVSTLKSKRVTKVDFLLMERSLSKRCRLCILKYSLTFHFRPSYNYGISSDGQA